MDIVIVYLVALFAVGVCCGFLLGLYCMLGRTETRDEG